MNWLGLSSGFDSRFLLHAMRGRGAAFSTFTFGQRGYADYDLSALLSERLALGTRFIDLGKIAWPLSLYDQVTKWIGDKPVHPRVVAAQLLEDEGDHGVIHLIHGFLNDALTETRPVDSWDQAVLGFLKKNDRFRWHSFFDHRWLASQLPEKPLMAASELSFYDQLSLPYRQTQCIKPQDYGNVRFLTPFANEKWIGFWLNQSEDERSSGRLWTNIIAQMQTEEFFDLNLLAGKQIALNKMIQIRMLYGHDGLAHPRPEVTSITPFAQICYYSCYRSNPSFRLFVDDSLARLRGRGIFRPGALDRICSEFMNGDAAAEKMMRGLVSVDVTIESGCFA